MAFRSYENVRRYEEIRFSLESPIRAPANVTEQQKSGYKFVIEDRGTFYDWFNAYFSVRFKLDLKANGGDNADTRTTIINGAHSLVKHMVIKSAGKIIYDTDNLHLVTFVKNLLEYSDDYARIVAKNSLWYLDIADSSVAAANAAFEARRLLTASRKLVNVNIPLNRYSFFEELEGRMLPPMDLEIEIDLTPDAELLYGDADTFRLTIDRFYLWVPRIQPKDALMCKFVSDFVKPSKWKYLRELYKVSGLTNASEDFRISASIDKVKYVSIYLQRDKSNLMDANPYIYDTFKLNAGDNNSSLSSCRLEYGYGVYYPERAYDSDDKDNLS